MSSEDYVVVWFEGMSLREKGPVTLVVAQTYFDAAQRSALIFNFRTQTKHDSKIFAGTSMMGGFLGGFAPNPENEMMTKARRFRAY